ncbi:hypothetical protein C8R44DRAFT_881231 [Mycena epipterygia]|nr:hypothetical protein C8R44DRAFT_881231 [Mycena epipterygia]
MSNAPYNDIAHANRFEPTTFMNWLDPRYTSADPAVSPRMQAHVLRTQLDAERIKGEGQLASVVSTSQRVRCARPYIAASLRGCAAASTLAVPVLRKCEYASRRGCDLGAGLHFQIASIVRALNVSSTLSDYLLDSPLATQRRPESNGRDCTEHYSMCEFDACERDMGAFLLSFSFTSLSSSSLPTLLFLACGVYNHVVLSHPARAPFRSARRSSREGVRHAPRPSALPAARACLLQLRDAERDVFSDYEATPRLLDAPHA